MLLPDQVGKYFKVSERGTSLSQELFAGSVTFITVGKASSQAITYAALGFSAALKDVYIHASSPASLPRLKIP